MRISGHGFTSAFVAAAVAIVFASPAISQEACKGLHRSVEGVVTAVNQSIAMAKADLDVNKGKPPMGSLLPTLFPQHSMDTLISAKAKIDELKGQLNDPEVSYASAIAVFSYMQAVVEILQAARFDTIDRFQPYPYQGSAKHLRRDQRRNRQGGNRRDTRRTLLHRRLCPGVDRPGNPARRRQGDQAAHR
jgi:hypothetical protein